MTAVSQTAEDRTSRAAWVALTRRALSDGRVRNIAFVYLFAVIAYIQPVGYRSAYKTLEERIGFARSFANNTAVRLFYGVPHDLLTVSGYSAWRVGGTLAIAAAVWGVLASVRALRAEEDAGRAEIVLSAPVSRAAFDGAALIALALAATGIWLVTWGALVVGGLEVAGSAYLALSIVSVIPVFAGIGALASQLAPRRRVALLFGFGAVAVSLLLRAVADTSGGASWLRWATPLGWAEEMRPFAGPRPWVLLLPLAAGAVLFAVAIAIALRRDLGSGLLPAHDSADARLTLLSSPTAQALRSEAGTIVVWLVCVGVFAYILGTISKSVTTAGISRQIQRELAKLGGGSIATAKGYLSFTFLLFVFAVSLFACAQIAAARSEEADGQLETLLALPVGRIRWLAGRLALAVGAAALISLTGGVLAWAGAISQGVHLSLSSMLLAGVNCLPLAALSLAAGALAFAIVPRAAAGIAYGLVVLAFFWELFGSLLSAPHWLLQATPFAHVGLVPQAPFRVGAAALMIAIAAACCAAALGLFSRRDLVT
jgi:ABC-2 type transport system permease protein